MPEPEKPHGAELKWFGVRTLMRIHALGRVRQTDPAFDRESTMVEDRIVLVRARSGDEATASAIEEAEEYCRRTRHKNIYGQQIRMKRLGVAEAFHIFDESIQSGTEVYSSTSLVDRNILDMKVVAERFGPDDCGGAARHKFLDGKILSDFLNPTKGKS